MSEKTWYVRHDDRVLGPFSEAEIVARLKACELTWLDLAIQPGDEKWRLLDQIPSLRLSLGIETGVVTFHEAWIFLRVEKKPRGGRRHWLGPWAREIAAQRLKSGELQFDDLAWREGMKNWVRVGDLVEFGADPKTALRQEPVFADGAPGSEVPAEELWRSIVHAGEIRRPRHEPPPEAAGEDLVGGPEWMKILMATVAALVLAAPLGGSRAYAAGSATEPARAAVANHLEIMPLKLTSEQPSLVLQTDASLEQTIQVTISGASGEILDLASYQHSLQIRRRAGEVPTINLAELKLPRGRYQIEAQVGEKRAATQIFLGVEDAGFKAQLAQHQKSLAAEHQLEKKTLFYTSRDLAALASRLSSAVKTAGKTTASQAHWRQFYGQWRSDLKSARAPLDRLLKDVRVAEQAFPQRLELLKRTADQLRQTAATLDEAMAQARDPASLKAENGEQPSPAQLAAEFRKISRESASLTVTRSN